ncbi:MAG: hypothetical protein JWQ07_2034 [Ramlibacter sp.]|nr:hypothetical protein [Ramlibacter sp.]
MKRLFALLAFSGLALSPVYGADIYRWVDENGRVQFSDTVPEQFKKSATHIDSRQYELTPAQRKDAEARTARDKERAAEAAERDAKVAAAPAAQAASAASPASATLPSGATSDCVTLRRRFAESNECFAPFFNANGSVKAEAFARCGPAVPYPARECSSVRTN